MYFLLNMRIFHCCVFSPEGNGNRTCWTVFEDRCFTHRSNDSILLQVPINVLNERFITVRFVFSAFFWCARVDVLVWIWIILSWKPTYWVNFVYEMRWCHFRWFGPGDIWSPRCCWNIFNPTSKWWNESETCQKHLGKSELKMWMPHI